MHNLTLVWSSVLKNMKEIKILRKSPLVAYSDSYQPQVENSETFYSCKKYEFKKDQQGRNISVTVYFPQNKTKTYESILSKGWKFFELIDNEWVLVGQCEL